MVVLAQFINAHVMNEPCTFNYLGEEERERVEREREREGGERERELGERVGGGDRRREGEGGEGERKKKRKEKRNKTYIQYISLVNIAHTHITMHVHVLTCHAHA